MNGLKQGSIAMLVAGLLAAPAIQADNSASAFHNTDDSGVLIGPQVNNIVTNGYSSETQWYEVLTTTLSNSGSPKDLIIGLSFETTLITATEVKGKKGDGIQRSDAEAAIQMMVVMDEEEEGDYLTGGGGTLADPGIVMFDKREQGLWAELGGILDVCAAEVIDDVETGIVICTFTEETIGLRLKTTEAHTFNFLTSDIGSGSHTIRAYAKLSANGDYLHEGDADQHAVLGKGTLSVWEVHGSMTTK